MTITAIWESGWEMGNADVELTANNSSATTSNPKTGTYCLSLSSNGLTYQEHSSNLSQCWIGAHVRHGVSSSTRDLFVLRQGTTNIVRILWDATNSQWVILCGTTEVARVTDVPFATQATYYHIGVDVKIHASAGWVYLYRDGAQIVSFDGDTNDGGSTFNRLYIGNLAVTGWTSGLIDDNVWYDTTGEAAPAPPHDYRLYALTPDGNGNYNEWDGSDGNATNNYLLVDEIPPNSDTDYLTTDTAADDESFTMTTFTIPVGYSVEEVIPLAVAKKVDSGGALGLKVGTRLSSTDQLSSTKTLGTAYSVYRERQPAKPGGGAWTQSDIDGLEVVIEAAA